MPRRLLSLCFCLSLLVGATTDSSTVRADDKTIVIEADEWCPINCTPGAGEEGIGIDLARKVFEPMGYKIRYVIVPWTQAVDDVHKGRIHAIVGANHHDDSGLIFPDSAIYRITDDFFVRETSAWRYQGPHTLKDKRIGMVEGYGYGDVVTQFIDQNKRTANVLFYASGNNPLMENVDMLINGKLDVVVENRAVMNYAMKNSDKRSKIKWAGSVEQDPVYIAFSPAMANSKELASYYDGAIRRMRADGSLNKLYAKYELQSD